MQQQQQHQQSFYSRYPMPMREPEDPSKEAAEEADQLLNRCEAVGDTCLEAACMLDIQV